MTLPEIATETQASGFQYSYEVDEPVKAGEGKVPVRIVVCTDSYTSERSLQRALAYMSL